MLSSTTRSSVTAQEQLTMQLQHTSSDTPITASQFLWARILQRVSRAPNPCKFMAYFTLCIRIQYVIKIAKIGGYINKSLTLGPNVMHGVREQVVIDAMYD